uniref:Uncharacterized protein n=1 Tax=Rhizophora mucronata TaxID=61149 RepID=A0A2P2R092_RHIMU
MKYLRKKEHMNYYSTTSHSL